MLRRVMGLCLIGAALAAYSAVWAVVLAYPMLTPSQGQPPELPGSAERSPAVKRDAPDQPETQERPARRLTEPFIAPKGQSDTDPCAGDTACYQRRDLRAQEDMAIAAFRLIVATWVQVGIAGVATIIAGIGTYLVLRSLRYSREATNAAARAADEAVKANVLSREAYIADQRPWVAITMDIESGITYENNMCCMTISYFARNSGKSPAIKASFEARLTSTPIGGDIQSQARKLSADQIWYRHVTKSEVTDVIFPTDSPMLIECAKHSINMMGHTMIDPHIVGCITYQAQFGVAEYQTVSTYEVARYDSEGVRVYIDINDGPIPKDGLQLIRVRGASFAT